MLVLKVFKTNKQTNKNYERKLSLLSSSVLQSHCLGNYYLLKNICSTLYTYWNGQNPDYWQRQMLVRMWSNRNSHSFLVWMQTDTVTLEDSLVIPYKTKHTLVMQSSSRAPWYLPKRVENLCLYKSLHMDVYSNSFHSCQNFKATKMSFSR